MRTWRLSLVGMVILGLLGGLGGVALAQDQASASPTATPRPVGEVCERIELPYDPEDIHLSGVWFDDLNNVAYISQVGSKIYLMHLTGRAEPPERLGRLWTVVATGTLADDGTWTLDYGVVPRGEWLFDDFGTITGGVVSQPGEATKLSIHYPATEARGELYYTLTPCAPVTNSTSSFDVTFRPAFTVRDEPRVGLSFAGGMGLAWLPASDHEGDASGITVWQIVPTAADTCAADSAPKLEPGADAFLAWLQSREDIVVSEPVNVTVDSRPATMVDLTPAPGATACLDDSNRVRLWTTYGTDAAIFTDSMTRVILMDVGDTTLAIEMYGDDQETWLPLAQRIVDTIHFTE